MAYLTFIVVLPLAALVAAAADADIWAEVTSPQARHAIWLTVWISLVVTLINVIAGTIIAWVLVRDDFRGKSVVNTIVDLPFALPTIVAGLTLLALYGNKSPVGIDITYSRVAIGAALLFVTLPFVVRSVQPVLEAFETEMEQAAQSLGASPMTVFRRIVLPNLSTAIAAGAGLTFARALGEFGSLVLISGNLPHKTEVASVFIAGQVENGNVGGAAAVSVVLLSASLLLVVLLRFVGSRGRRKELA